MQLKDEFKPIREWANQKGIMRYGNAITQTVKLMEEVGELASALLRNRPDLVADGIGDIVVVLTSLAYFNDIKIEDCINQAYQVIKDRQGRMESGNFVKADEQIEQDRVLQQVINDDLTGQQPWDEPMVDNSGSAGVGSGIEFLGGSSGGAGATGDF